MFTSLRSRLMLSYFFVAVICLLATSVLISVLIGPLQNRLTHLRLLDRSVPTVLWVRELRQRDVEPVEIARRFGDQADRRQIRMLLLGPDGQVLGDSDGEAEGSVVPQFLPEENGADRWPFRGEWRVPGAAPMLFVSLPAGGVRAIRRPLGADSLVVVLAMRERDRLLLEFLPFLAVAVVVGLVLSILFAAVVAGSLSRPLRQVMAAAEQVARGNFDQRLNITSPRELRRLSDSFNNMARQVKAGQQSQRDFVANVSHDLKTPLTSIRGFAEAILDGTAGGEDGSRKAAAVIQDEAERMGRLVDDLLMLARVSADTDRSSWTEVDVAALIDGCVERLRMAAEQNGVRLRVEMGPLPRMRGSLDRLVQLFSNLIDNAIRHSPPGSEILVEGHAVTSVTTGRRAEPARREIAIGISDCGPGIPEEDLPRIFERFYQVDKSRARQSGTGLGLAISKEIVEAHEGSIRAESRQGRGSRFVVTLPTQPAS